MDDRNTRHRARGRDGSAGETAGVGDPDLDEVTEAETIGDLVDVAEFSRRLPGGWGVVADVVPFGDEPLAEALVLQRSTADPKLLLKPVEMSAPGGPVEFHERRTSGNLERILTTEELDEAVRAAANWAHQRTE